jgi:hypothetical protein
MTIPEFFNIYRTKINNKGEVEFSVRVHPIFIFLSQNYSNNQGRRTQFFRVSGEWESVEPLPEGQRMHWEWRSLVIDLRERPVLNVTGSKRVENMLIFSRDKANAKRMDFDKIVMDDNTRTILGYRITKNKVLYDRKGKGKGKGKAKASKKARSEGTILGSATGATSKKKGLNQDKASQASPPAAAPRPKPPTSQQSMKKNVVTECCRDRGQTGGHS